MPLLLVVGVILAEDQRVAPTPPAITADSSPPSKASSVPGAGTLPAGPAKPGQDDTAGGGGGRGQPPLRHRSEGGLEERGPPRRRPHLSASHSDLLEAGLALQPWGSEDAVRAPGPAGERWPSRSPQESLSRSWPQCHTVPPGSGHAPEDLQGDVSGGQVVAVTLMDASPPRGDPLSPHEPIEIIITMSSARGSGTDPESSLHLQSGAQPATPGGAGPPSVEQRIPIITLELPEDGGGGAVVCPEGGDTPERWVGEAPSAGRTGREPGGPGSATEARSPPPGHPGDSAPPEGEQGRAGQARLDPASCESGQEKRHARVLSVDSGTEVLLSRSPAEASHEKERAMPTSKSDLEAKEGQTPNESNFLEFVSLLESISTAKVGAPGRRRGPAEPGKDGGGLPAGESPRVTPAIDRGRRGLSVSPASAICQRALSRCS